MEVEIGRKLIRAMMNEESSVHAIGYADAEYRLNKEATYRFKVGQIVERTSSCRKNGYPQGPSSSIEVALAFMSVWNRAVQTESGVATKGFIDDSSIRAISYVPRDTGTMLKNAICISREFGSLAGCKLNEAKTKALASDSATEKVIAEMLGYRCEQAMILVGGIMANGRKTSAKTRSSLAQKRYDKFANVVLRIKTAPTGQEGREVLLSRFAGPILTFGSELEQMSTTKENGYAGNVHAALMGSDTMFRSQGITMTLIAHGHIFHPPQVMKFSQPLSYCGDSGRSATVSPIK